MDIVVIISVFGVGFGVGFGVSKYITRESQKIFTLQKQALESRCKELEASKELLESKLSTLESSLANALAPSDERAYIDLVESLKRACESKDREIRSLEKRINSFRYAR